MTLSNFQQRYLLFSKADYKTLKKYENLIPNAFKNLSHYIRYRNDVVYHIVDMENDYVVISFKNVTKSNILSPDLSLNDISFFKENIADKKYALNNNGIDFKGELEEVFVVDNIWIAIQYKTSKSNRLIINKKPFNRPCEADIRSRLIIDSIS